MLQSYLSDFGRVEESYLNHELRDNVSLAIIAAREENKPLSQEAIGKIAAYIAKLEEALVEEDVHAVDETYVLDKLKANTGFDVRKEACTLEYMRAEDT